MKMLNEFKCALTGTECVVIENAFGEEIAITKSEYLELESYIRYDNNRLTEEQG